MNKAIKLLLKFLIKRTEDSKLRYNFLFAVLFFSTIIVSDLFLWKTGKHNFILNQSVIFGFTFFCFILSFCGIVVRTIFTIFFFITTILGLNYFLIFDNQIDFLKIYEFQQTFVEVFNKINQHIIINVVMVFLFVLIFTINIVFRKKVMFSMASIFFVELVISYFVYFYGIAKNQYKAKPSPSRMLIHNNLTTYSYAITHLNNKQITIPIDFSKFNSIKKIENQTLPRIIVLVISERTNARDLKVFNPQLNKDNTPRLEKTIKDDKQNFFLTTAISGSVGKRVSLSRFFNILYTSSNISENIVDNSSNLFTLAKKSGYKTHWISRQSIKYPEYAGIFADDIKVYANAKYSKKYKEYEDDYTIELFNNLDLRRGKHFIVLHLMTAKSPYRDRYKHHNEVFREYNNGKKGEPTFIDDYYNAMLYLDFIIDKIIRISKSKEIDLVIYTADRGEKIDDSIDEDGYRVLSLDNAEVPFLLYTKESSSSFVKNFTNPSKISHYEIGQFIAKMLGYEVKSPYEEKDIFYISDGFWNEELKHMCIKREKDGKISKTIIENLNEYYDRYRLLYTNVNADKKVKKKKQNKKD